MKSVLKLVFILALLSACVSSEEQSLQFRQRMRAESDSICRFNSEFALRMQDTNASSRQLSMMQYRVKLSDRLMFVQYDHVPAPDSMLWLTAMHVLRSYHQQTYELLPALVWQPNDRLSKDSFERWEAALWKRCGDLLSPEFKLSDSCRLSRQLQ